jgi:hypothetical protein
VQAASDAAAPDVRNVGQLQEQEPPAGGGDSCSSCIDVRPSPSPSLSPSPSPSAPVGGIEGQGPQVVLAEEVMLARVAEAERAAARAHHRAAVAEAKCAAYELAMAAKFPAEPDTRVRGGARVHARSRVRDGVVGVCVGASVAMIGVAALSRARIA